MIHGLYLLHNMGYIHRDIKPQNILLKKDKSGINVYLKLSRCINWLILVSLRKNKMLVELFWALRTIWRLRFLIMICTVIKLICGHLVSYFTLCSTCNFPLVHIFKLRTQPSLTNGTKKRLVNKISQQLLIFRIN